MAKKQGNKKLAPAGKTIPEKVPPLLLEDLRVLIQQTRQGVAQAVNSPMVLLYWQVGDRSRTEILKKQRAGYGDEIVAALSREFTVDFGGEYTGKSLSQMIQNRVVS